MGREEISQEELSTTRKEEETYPRSTPRDDRWFPYRYDEVKKYGQGKFISLVEGEKCVEAIRYLGLVSTTFQGSNWSKKAIEEGLTDLQKAGIAGIIFHFDNDGEGERKAKDVEAIAAKLELPCLLIRPTLFWEDCPNKGDIADWVKESLMAGDLDREFLIEKLNKIIESVAQDFPAEEAIEVEEEENKSLTSIDLRELYLYVKSKYGDQLRLNILGQKIELDGKPFDCDRVRSFLAINYLHR